MSLRGLLVKQPELAFATCLEVVEAEVTGQLDGLVRGKFTLGAGKHTVFHPEMGLHLQRVFGNETALFAHWKQALGV